MHDDAFLMQKSKCIWKYTINLEALLASVRFLWPAVTLRGLSEKQKRLCKSTLLHNFWCIYSWKIQPVEKLLKIFVKFLLLSGFNMTLKSYYYWIFKIFILSFLCKIQCSKFRFEYFPVIVSLKGVSQGF